jgi:hypothetical protein
MYWKRSGSKIKTKKREKNEFSCHQRRQQTNSFINAVIMEKKVHAGAKSLWIAEFLRDECFFFSFFLSIQSLTCCLLFARGFRFDMKWLIVRVQGRYSLKMCVCMCVFFSFISVFYWAEKNEKNDDEKWKSIRKKRMFGNIRHKYETLVFDSKALFCLFSFK